MVRQAVLQNVLNPATSNSDDLAVRVEAALHRHPHLCGCAITCIADRQTITLVGQVPTYYVKQIAQTVAAEVDGVERVFNDVAVR